MSPRDTLSRRISDGSARIGVIGQGYVGLPLAIAFAEAGHEVTGIDTDAAKIGCLAGGSSPIGDVSDERVAGALGTGRYRPASSYEGLGEIDAVFVCVPTPFDPNKTPDLTYVRQAADGVSQHLRVGHLVILQSTTYPGTTEEVMLPALARSGLQVGSDFFLAFSPERIDPGVPEHTVRNTPKVVGGVTDACTGLAAALLAVLGPEVHTVSGPRAAEMTKLLENIFRSVNIALANEMALLAEHMGIDFWEVIDAAATKPFGFMPFHPGAGVGGHCIPVDPYFLAWKAREYDFSTRFIELAADINQAMPRHVARLVAGALAARGASVAGARVLILGAAFKPDVDDARNSPARRVTELLVARGAKVVYADAHVPELQVGGNVFLAELLDVPRVSLTDEELRAADAVVIVTAHSDVDYARVGEHARLVVDAANATGGGPRVVRLGTADAARVGLDATPSAPIEG